MPIDESREFLPLNIAVVTISDTRTEANDTSGDALARLAQEDGHKVTHRSIVRDDVDAIRSRFVELAERSDVQVVVSTGGTGITLRDGTPEVLSALADKEIPGFGELFRMLSYDMIGTSTIQSRATAALIKKTLFFALPGSTGACHDGWEKILRFQLDIRHRPCNFAELFPRL